MPMLDLINCMEGPDPSRVHSTRLDTTGKFAITKAAWSFKKGEQLFEPYGQPNHIYFSYHGFVLDHNSHDCVRMDLALDRSDAAYDEKSAALRKVRLREQATFCIAPRKITNDILQFLRVSRDAPTRKDQRDELVKECRRRLERYKTSVSEDEQLLLEDSLPYSRLVAIKFRLSEKKLLSGIIEQLGGGRQSKHEL